MSAEPPRRLLQSFAALPDDADPEVAQAAEQSTHRAKVLLLVVLGTALVAG